MATCVECKSDVGKRARFCPRCGRADPAISLSGPQLLMWLLLIAAAIFAVIARQLQLI